MEESKRQWEREQLLDETMSERAGRVSVRAQVQVQWVIECKESVCVFERDREQERLRRVCKAERFSVCVCKFLAWELCECVCVCVALLFFFTLLAWELKNDIKILRSYDIAILRY